MLTAGLGTRLRPFTETLPKPVLPFLNLPLLNYGFFLAHQAGFNQFLFNKHYLPDKVEKQIKTLSPHTQHIQISDETQKILGSGGAIWKARKILQEHDYFLIANGDEILIPKQVDVLGRLINQFKKDNALCTLLTCDHPDLLKGLKPVWVNQQGEVCAFGLEKPSANVSPVHYTGYKVFSKRILNLIPEGESNIFYDVVKAAIDKGEMVTTLHLNDCHWFETGNFNSFLNASKEITHAHWNYVESVHSFFSQRLSVIQNSEQDLLVHHTNQNIPADLNFHGFNTLGKQVQLPKNITLANSFVCDGAILNSNQNYKNSFLF